MAAIQTSLNDYFKNAKSAREGIKQIKGSLQPEQDISGENNAAKVVQLIELKNKSIENIEVIEVKLNSLKENVAKNTSKKTKSTKQTTSRNIKGSDKIRNESILSAFSKQNLKESQSSKRKRATEDEEEETCDQKAEEITENSDKGEENKKEHTPQNIQKTLENQRKRRCTTVENDKSTPNNKTQEESSTVQRSTRGSARKKLLLGESPCSSEVKNDTSAAALRQKLIKCNKLNELRAQLLKVKTCEKDLAKFKAGVQKAQHEKDLARAALGLSPSMAFPLSPRKAAMSPLKAPSSPRKLYSPHRLAASPYLPPPSPRTKPPHPQLQQFSGLDVEVPLSPCKTPTKTPPASPLSRTPAYQRYSHLLQDTTTVTADEQSELSLPYKYRLMRELFRSVDTVVSMLHNRHEAITFSRLRTSVQQMVRRTFSESNLGQLKAMFPLAYFYKQEKIRPGASSSANSNGSSTSGYELTIAANLNYRDTSPEDSKSTLTGAKVNLMGRLGEEKCSIKAEHGSVKAEKQSSTAFRKMDSLVLVERRSIFHASLLKAIHQHHLDFLKTLDPPVAVPDPKAIKRWHPSFDLDSVPDVQPDDLPAPPVVQSYSDANSVLVTARNLFSLNSRLEKAVENVASLKEEKPEDVKPADQPKAAPPPPQNKNVALALKGISASLLERIRAREAAQASKVMLRTPSQTKRLTQLSALPQMARILRHSFIADKKAALPIEAVIKVLKESHTGMLTQGELFDNLDLLIEEVPQFVSKHKLSSGIFIKVDKKTDINVIVQQIDKKIKLAS